MGVRAYLVKDYGHKAESDQFRDVRECLEAAFLGSEDECVVIGNVNVGGVELDALLATPGGMRILEFKNWGGDVVAGENGPWTADGRTILGGSWASPFEQARRNRSLVARWLRDAGFGDCARRLTVTVVFRKPSRFTNRLSRGARAWLRLCDNDRVGDILEGLGGKGISNADIAGIPVALYVEGYELRGDGLGPGSPGCDPGAAAELYGALGEAMAKAPDYGAVYGGFRRVLGLVVEQCLDRVAVPLGSPARRMDSLLADSGASPEVRGRVARAFRSILESSAVPGDGAGRLGTSCPHDLRGLCEAVESLYGIGVPEALCAMFPKGDGAPERPPIDPDCVRMVVDSFDDDFIHGFLEGSDGAETRVPFRMAYHGGRDAVDLDWGYLKGFLGPGSQVNLVMPREVSAGEVHAELIVYEPDCLIDVTTVAGCFEQYATSSLVNLLKKVQPQEGSYHLTLGNFASQLLDDVINHAPGERTYADSVRAFFGKNAVALASMGDGERKDFHRDGRAQLANIERAMRHDLPASLPGTFNGGLGIVEPSFFSEMLGLQGRMDYLQRDFRVLLEQKSGKSAGWDRAFVHPQREKEQHYVQTLLYMLLIMYNYRRDYEANGKRLDAFLLYSKYERGLLPVRLDPGYVHSAMRVRNEIARDELRCAMPGGFRALDTLTVEDVNQKGLSGRFWEQYLRGPIERVLGTVQGASELERSYFHRFLTFIANEHMLSRMGNGAGSGFASMWHDSLEDKLHAGNILAPLALSARGLAVDGCLETLRFGFRDPGGNGMSNFRPGDIVVAYPYPEGRVPDARRTMVFRCTMEEMGQDGMTLRLRAPQSSTDVFRDNLSNPWAIEHDHMEASFASQYRGMYTFLEAPRPRRELLLFQRAPGVDGGVAAPRLTDHGEFTDLVMRVRRSRDIFLVIGPPGTGKTSLGLMHNLREELADPDASVLLMAYTNRAVDEIAGRLIEDGIDFMMLGHDHSASPRAREHQLGRRIADASRLDDVAGILASARVFVGTTTSMNSNLGFLRRRRFSLAIIDEASQILEPQLVALFCAHDGGVPTIGRFLLIGDHKQLPAIVRQSPAQSRVQDPLLNPIGLDDCRRSLFERFLRRYGDDPSVTCMLTRQGRMHPDVALFPNCAFYGNRLEAVPLEHQARVLPPSAGGGDGIDRILATRRLAFIGVVPEGESPSDMVNQAEADVIARFACRIYAKERDGFDPYETVGVIVPYRNQIAAVRKAIDAAVGAEFRGEGRKAASVALREVTVDTVERFQGSQRRYVIYGFTVQRRHQLGFLTGNVFVDADGTVVDRKLNVAMTRAKECLVMVGNPRLLSNDPIFHKLMEFARSRHGYFEGTCLDLLDGDFPVPDRGQRDVDMGQCGYELPGDFSAAFTRLVTAPLREASGEGWPDMVLGRGLWANMEAIGYGRTGVSAGAAMPGREGDAGRLALLQCHYLARRRYCAAMGAFRALAPRLERQVAATRGRVELVDLGAAGPATCGLAFAGLFLGAAPGLSYHGVERSAELRRIGGDMLREVFHGRLRYGMLTSLADLGEGYWDEVSRLPSTVILNVPWLLAGLSDAEAGRLALEMLGTVEAHPLNRYLVVILGGEWDGALSSCGAFTRALQGRFAAVEEGHGGFRYEVDGRQGTDGYSYTLLEGL